MRIAAWFVLAALASASSRADAATDEGRLVTRKDGKTIDVPLEHTDVKIRVDGFLADAVVTQRFRNPYATKIEAVYMFPLPTDAAVTDMTIANGTRVIRGTIQERDKATRVYEAARGRGLVAALLTQERVNLFTQSVANLEPSATIDVTIHYVQRLHYESGGYEIVFPMVAGPRYMPGDAAAPAVQPAVLPPGVRSSHDISLAVTIDAGVPIEGIASPSHQIAIERPLAAPSRASVAIRPADTIPNKDFVLRYQVAGEAPRFGVLAHRDGGDGSFLFLAQPPDAGSAGAVTPREIVFLLDTSSSMRGAPLAKAKELIRRVLMRLRPDDTFQIVRFDDRASALGPGPVANKPRNVELTLSWLAALDAGGGTEMATGIDAALAVPHDPQRLRIVAFLTDGYVGNEDEIIANVDKRRGDARVFCFGIGSAVNRYLLEELAAAGRGAAQFVRPDEDATAAVAAFERRIDAPVLTDVRIDWGPLAIADATPRALPDLFVGEPLVVSGHYRASGVGMVTVHGKRAGKDVAFTVPVALPDRDASRPAIATVWARRRIAELSRQLIRKSDAAVEREIVALSLAHHLLTQFTAFVAVDESRVTAGGAAKRVAVPVEIPDAVAGLGPLGYGMSGFGAGGGGSGWGAIGVGTYATIGHGSSSSDGFGYGVGGGSGEMRGRVAAVPVVMIAAPIAVGSIDKAIIRRYVKRSTEKLSYCYEKQLLHDPKLEGTVTAHFLIGRDGKVLSVTADGLDPTVASCVASVIKDIEFPAATDGGDVQVNYPFTFRTTEHK
jgi:Ca-activated chloride channel family protein